MGVIPHAALRTAWMLAGLFVLSYGIDLQRMAGLGLMPWSVLHEGLSLRTFLTFGQANVCVGLVLIAIGLLFGVRPSLGTVITMVMTGVYIDFIWTRGLLPTSTWTIAGGVEAWRYLYMVAGVVVMGFGTAWYVCANLGAGPRDGLMIGLVRLTRLPVGVVRSFLEGAALLTGWLLGGPVGTGTVFSVICLGWVIQFSLQFFRWLLRFSILNQVLKPPAMERPAVKGA